MQNDMLVTLSQEENKRSEELLALKLKLEAKLAIVSKELRQIIYSLDRKP